MAITETLIDIPAESQAEIFGRYDQFIKKIEKTLHITVISRDSTIKLVGDPGLTKKAAAVLRELHSLAGRGEPVTEQNVDYALAMVMDDRSPDLAGLSDDIICHTINGKPVRPKTSGQQKYVDAIRKDMIVFGIGPAGTGKTYLAMAMAVKAFKNNDVNRIILTRPAIEAGEKLGFLPGDLQSKVDPYLRPLYDALYDIMGAESFLRNMEKGLIEVAPLAYMRGRTLDNAFIVLDEAQNTTPAQMKMFLTRVGFGSKVIVTGDITQKDLPAGQVSGLDIALKVLKGIEGITTCTFSRIDVVRHPLVARIVDAYEAYEKKETSAGRQKNKKIDDKHK